MPSASLHENVDVFLFEQSVNDMEIASCVHKLSLIVRDRLCCAMQAATDTFSGPEGLDRRIASLPLLDPS